MKLRSKKSLVIATALFVAAGSTSALAYWTTTGSGTGSATNASASGAVVLHATFAGALTPGATQDVTYTGDNAGSSSLFVSTITPVVSVDSAHAALGCLAADFSATSVTSNTRVAAGASGTALGAGTITFADTAANQDGCKGATVTITASSN